MSDVTRTARSQRLTLSRLLARQERSYAGADLGNSRRMTALLWALSSLFTLIFVLIEPPTERIGAAGTIFALALVVGGVVGVRTLLDDRRSIDFDALLLIVLAGVVQAALLQYLSGGEHFLYSALLVLWVSLAAGQHPLRRALPLILLGVGAAALPLLYEDGAAEAVTRDVLIIAGAGLSVLVLMTYVRAQRVGLSAGAEKAEALARADALTGVGNRRAFDEALTAEVSRTVRAGSPLSVALIDLDDFKVINDRHGHLEGDRYLRQVTAAVTHTIRGGDRCFRWGGDELAVLLPDTPRAEADAVCRRVCAAVTSACSTSDGEPIKLSYGVAELTEGATPIELVRAADEELMHTKERKRAPARFARADATE